MRTFTLKRACARTRTHTFTNTHTHSLTHTHTHTHTHTYTHTHTHTLTHTHSHTHTHWHTLTHTSINLSISQSSCSSANCESDVDFWCTDSCFNLQAISSCTSLLTPRSSTAVKHGPCSFDSEQKKKKKREEKKKRTQAFETKRMRKLLRISYLEQNTNDWVRSKINFLWVHRNLFWQLSRDGNG